MFTTKVKVAGVKFKNRDGTSRQEVLETVYMDWWTEGLEDDLGVELRPEPENEHDPYAVAVWVVEPPECEGQVGYVPSGQAEFVCDAIHEGRLASVDVDDMGVSGKRADVWMRLRVSVRHADDSPDDEDDEALSTVEDADGRVYEID